MSRRKLKPAHRRCFRQLVWLGRLIHGWFHLQLISPARPKKPCGRTIRTIAISAKIDTLRHFRGEQRGHADDDADQQSGKHSAADRAHAADHRHDKGFGKDGTAHLRTDALKRRGQQSRETRNRGSDAEHNQPDPSDVDAEHANNLRIARAGANDQPETGLFQKQPKRQQHRRGRSDHKQPIERKITRRRYSPRPAEFPGYRTEIRSCRTQCERVRRMT